MNGMRIGLVGPLPPPSGGMANQTRQLAALLASEGARVEVVQTNAPYRPGWIAGIHGLRAVFRLLPFVVRLWISAGRVDLFHVMANSGWAWHLFAMPAICVGRLRRVPVVVNYRGGAASEFLERSASLVRAAMRLADRLIVPSGFLVEIFARHGMHAQIVPNVVDLKRFAPATEDVVPGRRAPHLVVTRNLEPIYDIDTALHAFRIVRDQHAEARLTIAGSGPERNRLEAASRILGLDDRVTFTGRLDNDEVAALYRDADVLLNPSRVDNTPISILEALAVGVPVVTTDAGGIRHLVTHRETALVVPVGDATAMARAAIEVLQDTTLRQQMTAAGRTLAQKFSWSAVHPQLLGLYGELVAKPAATPAAHAK